MKNILFGVSALLLVGTLVAFSPLAHRSPVSLAEAQDPAFQEFLTQFAPTTLPYSISKKSLQQYLSTYLQTAPQPKSPYEVNKPGILLQDPRRHR